MAEKVRPSQLKVGDRISMPHITADLEYEYEVLTVVSTKYVGHNGYMVEFDNGLKYRAWTRSEFTRADEA
jgi:hypothetical protein